MPINWEELDKELEQIKPSSGVDWTSIDKELEDVKTQPKSSVGENLINLAVNLPQTFAEPLTYPERLIQTVPESFGGKAPSAVIQNQPFFRTREEQWTPAFLRSLAGKAVGGVADVATTPLTYIIPPALKAATMNVPAQAFIKKYLPTLGKGLITKEAVKPTIKPTPAPTQPEMVGSLRPSKFPPEVRPVIEAAQPTKTPIRTFAQQRATAETLKETINIDTLKPQDILNAEARRAAGLKVIDNAKAALVSNKIEDMQAVYSQINKLNGLHSEAGRLLGSLRDPLFDMDDEAIKVIHDGLRRVIPESKESLAKFFKQVTQPGLWDKFMEYRTASLLTSPYTHERNIIGNTIGRLSKLPERIAAGNADAVRSFLLGQPRERYASEALADTFGMVRGFRPAIRSAFNALLNEDFAFSSRTREALRFGKAIPGVVGKIIRLPFRALNAMDEFFSTLNSTSSLYAQAYRQAFKEGSKDIITRTAQLVKKPSMEMLANATREALQETYRQPLGKAGRSIQSALMQSKIGKFIVPFFRTPVNLFKWTFDRSPLGLYKLATKSFYQLSPGQMMDEVGKMAVGQIITAGMAYEAVQGNITGRLSNNKAKGEALMRQGIMPYSIKIGDKYHSYRGFEPISTWLSLVANSTEQWKEKDQEPVSQQVISVLLETVKFMKDQPFLMGIKDLFNALDDPEKMGSRFLQNVATSVTVPTGVAYTARLLDPTIREPETIPEAIRARLPGLSKTIPPKLDVWGRPITKEGKLMERAINPAGAVTEKPDLVEEELLSLEKFPTKIAKKYRELPLSTDERNTITKIEGGIVKGVLDNLMRSSEYQTLNTLDREKLVDKIFRDVRTEVRKIFLDIKIQKDLQGFTNREEKIKYIQGLIEKKIIKPQS